MKKRIFLSLLPELSSRSQTTIVVKPLFSESNEPCRRSWLAHRDLCSYNGKEDAQYDTTDAEMHSVSVRGLAFSFCTFWRQPSRKEHQKIGECEVHAMMNLNEKRRHQGR